MSRKVYVGNLLSSATETAIRELAGYEMNGRPLRVDAARECRPGGGQREGPRRCC